MPKKHQCKFSMHYAAGEAYEVCSCGAVQRVSPDGKRSKAPKSLVALARRNHGAGGNR